MSDLLDRLLGSKAASLLFGGDPRQNERRYMANADLLDLTVSVYPWTEEALRAAVREWLGKDRR